MPSHPSPPDRSAPVLGGIDIGGTKIGLCIGAADGKIAASDRLVVDHALAPEAIMSECRERLAALAERIHAPSSGADPLAALHAVGCACPGPLDYAQGRFINPPNNPRWHGFAIRDWLAANFPCPTSIMNDANAAALAEWKWGAARSTRNSVFLTMSTGMGAGLIIDGRLFEGPAGLAGEIGRTRLRDTDDGPVGFGRRGTVEGYCSGPGMSQLAESEAIISAHCGELSELRIILIEEGRITPERLCEAARAGDAAAIRVTHRIATELGRIMAIMTNILNPEVFVLGTIGTAYPDLFLPRAMEILMQESIPAAAAILTVRPSALENRGDAQALAVAVHMVEKAAARA